MKFRDSLTTKFVHDWRAKDYTLDDGSVTKRWLRRSRLVARECAFMERRDDCFSPATSTHVMNLLPMVYLQLFRPTPSWLPSGRSTRSGAWQKIELQINKQGRLLLRAAKVNWHEPVHSLEGRHIKRNTKQGQNTAQPNKANGLLATMC